MPDSRIQWRLPPMRRLIVAIVTAASVFSTAAGLTQDLVQRDLPQREGYFEVRSASTRLVDGVHELDARLQLVLSSEALEALNNSQAVLRIKLEIQLIRQRRFYMDALEHTLEQEFELEYSEIPQRYIVRNINSGDQDSFATLYSALNNLGRIDKLEVFDDVLLSPNRNYRIRMRALLQTEQYSAPLRIVFFWRSQWQLKSDWFEWMLER
ncbi:MAG: DUF4390 domain-containing protein [Woeseiaceae bacterium]